MNGNNPSTASPQGKSDGTEGSGAQASVLLSWIGRSDLKARRGDDADGPGPIARAVASRSFDRLVLLSNFAEAETASYLARLARRTRARVEGQPVTLTNPANNEEIFRAASTCLARLGTQPGPRLRLTFLLSPGTPAMAAVWIILAKTRFEAALAESSPDRGVQPVEIPFP